MSDYLDAPYAGGSNQMETKSVRMPTLKERLDMQVKDAEDRLRDAKRAREILDKNPEMEELMNIMQKGRF